MQCVIPETAIALLERSDEVIAQDVKLSSLRQRGKTVRALYSAKGPNSNPPRGVAFVVCLVPASECEVVCGVE